MTARSLRSIKLSQTGFYAFLAPLAGIALLASLRSTPVAAAPGFFWADGYREQDIIVEAPRVRRPRPPVLPHGADKAEKLAAQGSKPQGPLVIAISIQRQQVKVYDSRGLFAESPISSGMAGHATPMGVFSIIQKHKLHRSNIYSGAPMPYMQRITWSGVAMHAGVLPGYPASHGCIRMPMSFAMKMWGWTRMGARVVVTPGEVSPVDFPHPALDALTPPAPVAATPVAANVKTADASGGMTLRGAQRVIADAATGGMAALPESATDVAVVASIVAEAISELPSAEANDRPSDTAANDGLPVPPTPARADFSDLDAPAPDALPVGKTDLAVNDSVSVSAAVEVAPAEANPAKDQTQMDQAQIAPSPSEPAPVAAPLIKRNSPVAIFVSRKDAKIYVRQNFTPVFDMPIEIATGDRPLGTHVFTARSDSDDDKKLQWSVVSMPSIARQAGAAASGDRNDRRRRTGAVEVAQPSLNTAGEALARLALPAELMARLGETLPAGSSLVVSDQGIAQSETGEGTDFIVRLR